MVLSNYWTSDTRLNWKAAVVLGLISSTFSTFVSQFTAGRIGRDAFVDWMIVASIPLRDAALQSEPTWPIVAAGILFHQWADFSWEVLFFGLFGFLTARLSPWMLLVVAGPWAVFTSASEWFFLVPIVPFWQPIFPLEQTYWIGFLVHATSASIYPLYPFVRDFVGGRRPSPNLDFAKVWSALAVSGLLVLGAAAWLGSVDREFPHVGGNVAFDQEYLSEMKAHHLQGIELAQMAAEKAVDPHLAALGRLMTATQKGDIVIFDKWWRSWFGALPADAGHSHFMEGMVSPEMIAQLQQARGNDFDALFIRVMSFHHAGAIKMSDLAMIEGGDPRIKIMAHALRHQQSGEIELMKRTDGLAAVLAATGAMLGAEPRLP
ncbi:MAG: hypothetical protein JWR75_1309 [Devosia sp.]|nr:hypothetical protein [Devosia sp.]